MTHILFLFVRNCSESLDEQVNDKNFEKQLQFS